MISGYFGLATARRGHSSKPNSAKEPRRFPLMEIGWHIPPTSLAGLKYPCRPTPDLAANTKSQLKWAPVWNPSGRELFYRSGNKIVAVKVATHPTFSAGEARVLFEGQYSSASREGQIPSY